MKEFVIRNLRLSHVKCPPYNNSLLSDKKELGFHLNVNRNIPRTLWLYWDGEITSITVRCCIERIRKIHPNFVINILNNESLYNFLPDFPKIEADIPIANITDLVRLMLLYRYGGIWIDASIVFDKSIDSIFDLDNISEDLIAFYDQTGEDTRVPIIESWFLIAPPKSNFVGYWLDVFMKCILSNNPGDYFKSRKDYEELVKTYKRIAEYWIVYTSAQVVLLEYDKDKYKIKLYNSAKFPNYFNHYIGWSSMHIAKFLLLNKYKDLNVPFVKLVKEMRFYTDFLIEHKQMRKDSYLGRFIK